MNLTNVYDGALYDNFYLFQVINYTNLKISAELLNLHVATKMTISTPYIFDKF